jgi:hypothetical protein
MEVTQVLDTLTGFVQAPPVAALLQYLVIEVVKGFWEKSFGKIPNKWLPFISTTLGAGIGSLPMIDNPLLGLVVGAASSTTHDMIEALKRKKSADAPSA